MTYTWKGQAGVLKKQEVVTDPLFGFARVEEWEGSPQFCDSLFYSLHENGIRATILREGMPWRVIATFQDVSEIIEAPRVEWHHDTELIDKSLFALEGVQQEAATYTRGPVNYRRTLEKHFDEEADDATGVSDFVDDFPPASYPFAHQIWFELSRGVQDYQESVEVIRRVRVASLIYPFARAKLSARLVYSTVQIGVPFDIITGIYHPPDQDQAIVGWRLRGQSYILEAERRVETIEFVLAAWSTLAYEASSGGFI